MSLEQKINSLVGIGTILHQFVTKKNINTPTYVELEEIINLSEIKNPWFTRDNILTTLKYWGETLTYETISQWLSPYDLSHSNSKTIGLILAGNIPMVGLHDCICVLLSGHKAKIKLSSKDNILIPFFLSLWKEYCNDLNFEFIDRLKEYDAVITTGSNNTAKYFEYYFKDIPTIIRKNRTSVAVLSGNETKEELNNLATDIFTYFGLGCRNVTQIFIPENYELNTLFEAFLPYHEVINHNKYANNYDYNKAIFLLNNDNFWDNNFILLKESEGLYSPIGTLYFQNYKNIEKVTEFISHNQDKIQCVVSSIPIEKVNTIPPGETQNPKINEYADGVDTLNFLLSLK